MPKYDDREFWESAIGNTRDYNYFYYSLLEVAISRFKWNNMPESVNKRYLETILSCKGRALFFQDDVLGYLTLKTAMMGGFNVYHEPIKRRAYGDNGYNWEGTIDNSVIIYNTLLKQPDLYAIQRFAKKLYDCSRAQDVNINAQKTPILITCEESQRLTMKNLYMKYEGNMPVIYGNKNLDPSSLKVLKTDAPYVADKLHDHEVKLWSEALTYLGVDNIAVNKKERLNLEETTKMQGQTSGRKETYLKARQQACEEINKMFGLNISVEMNQLEVKLDDRKNDDNTDGKGGEQK